MQEKKQEQIICPFCCYRFHPNQADFRLGGSVKSQDEKLINYYTDVMLLDITEAKEKSVQPASVSLEADGQFITFDESDIEKYGFVQRITYAKGKGKKQLSEQRLCPNCHNNLPVGYGMRDTLLISILGDARSGKSVYLTMLIAELENNADFTSKLTFIGDKQTRDNFFENYQKPLLKEHTLISSTKRKKIPPYAFNYWYQYKDETGDEKENSVDIIFYDIAGEDLRDDVGIRNNGFSIKYSSGLIFLADPTNFKRLADLFRFSDSALIEAIPEENSNQAIFNTLYNYFIGFDREKSSIPFALAISKADLFKHVNFDFFNNKPENRIQHIIYDEIHRGAVNIPSIKGINEEVREILSYLNEDGIINNAVGCFKNVSCFALSSLGKKPIVEKISDPATNETVEKGFIDGQLEPFRVKDPFYWILMRNQLLPQHENNRFSLNKETTSETEEQKPVSILQQIANFFTKLLSKHLSRE
ncbi:MAG: hypothetical protein FWC32_12780 [Firmicutes bacterium]|nr:hypothetical protein [Bacillota bacterium]